MADKFDRSQTRYVLQEVIRVHAIHFYRPVLPQNVRELAVPRFETVKIAITIPSTGWIPAIIAALASSTTSPAYFVTPRAISLSLKFRKSPSRKTLKRQLS
jgi:hypothetical protein